MPIINTRIGRYFFISNSALAGGGMVIGFSWLASCKLSPEEVLALPKEWFEFNGYLKIGDTVWLPSCHQILKSVKMLKLQCR